MIRMVRSAGGWLLALGLGCLAEPSAPVFHAVQVDGAVGIGYGIATADVNGDRKPDILLADRDRVVWYENPTWQKHVLAGKLTTHDHVCLAAADTDGDGRCEVAVGAEWNPSDTVASGAVFFLIPPADRRQSWEPVRLPPEPTVHRMRWVRNADRGFDLVVVPLHGRGNDPRAGTGAGVKIVAYRQPADPKAAWTAVTLDDALHKTHNFDPVQWDADPEEELLVAAKEGVFLLDRDARGSKRRQLSGAEGGGAGEVRMGRLARGQRFFATVEPMHGSNLVIYTEPARDNGGGLWQRQVLDSTLGEGHALACGDLAGVGSDQIVVGWRAKSHADGQVGIKRFRPLDQEGRRWEAAWVDENGMACEDLCLADLDADGRLDIVAAGRATKNLRVYFNRDR